MFLQVSLPQFDCARSFIRLSPGTSLNFNFAIDFKNKIAIEQKLIEEYGNDAVVDLKTGEVKPPEKKEENGENK